MVGVRQDFRYAMQFQDGTTFTRCLVNVDADSTSLILNGIANTQALALSASVTLRTFIPPASGRLGKNISARGVQVEYTDGLPPGISSAKVWIVVFLVSRFNAYAVGQTGTLKGLPVECVAKFDGRPNVNGDFGV